MALDWTILHWIQNTLTSPPMDSFMVFVTRLGNMGFFWILSALLLMSQKKYRKQAIILLLALLAGQFLNNLVIKNLVQRSRPCWLDPSVRLLIDVPKDFSFPSGHSMSSAIGAAMMTWTDRRLGLVAISLAILIIFSRLYLYVHFPTDVLAGVIVGLSIAFAAIYLARKYGKNKPQALGERN
ncbi:MAG: phosphatase PAP2 family protein [Firmicutes bacterium]|nr:phosphatase PAP2 family protein [Bacillota bacterium]